MYTGGIKISFPMPYAFVLDKKEGSLFTLLPLIYLFLYLFIYLHVLCFKHKIKIIK